MPDCKISATKWYKFKASTICNYINYNEFKKMKNKTNSQEQFIAIKCQKQPTMHTFL